MMGEEGAGKTALNRRGSGDFIGVYLPVMGMLDGNGAVQNC